MPTAIDHLLLMEQRTYPLERLLTRRNAWITLLVLALVSVLFGAALRNVKLDHDFESFFPTDDPELDRYMAFRGRFGHDNDYLLIGAGRERSVFDKDFLNNWDSLSIELADLPDVVDVTTPTRMSDPRSTPFGIFQVPWLRIEQDSTMQADSARIWQDERIRSTFFAADGRSILMILTTEPGMSKVRSDVLMEAVQLRVDSSGIPGIRMGGRIHGQFWYIQKMLRELVFFFSLSVLLLIIFLYVGFRTAWGVLVPIGVVGLSVLWQVGMITLLGKPLSILTMLLPTILFVVGMSDVVHILERYIEALRKGLPKSRALALTYHEVGLATLLTSITTAIGFATLLTSGIRPIREFGAYTAIGVLVAFALAFTLLPAILLLVRTPIQAGVSEERAVWYPVLHRLFRWVLAQRKRIPWYFGLLGLACMAGIWQLKVNNFLLEDWPDDDPQKQDYFWFDDRFGGVRGFEMEISASNNDRSVWELDALREMEQVQQRVEAELGVKAILSPVTLMKAMNKAMNGGAAEFEVLPATDDEANSLLRKMKFLGGERYLRTLVTEDGKHARMTGRMRDDGGFVHAGRNRTLEYWIRSQDRVLTYHQTGMAHLIDLNNRKLSAQLIGGLSIAFLMIAGIMAWVFRDLRMTVISLIPNIAPLLFIAGIMGFSGIDIKVSTAIIFTIAFGIAVDDTIHMLGKLRIELAKGRSVAYAMKRAYLSAGKAVVVTTIMLVSGFIALVFSDFASVFYMGLLVSSTLAMALLADLILLPALVMLFFRKEQ